MSLFLPPFEFRRWEKEEGFNEPLLAVPPVNSAGAEQLERGRGSEGTEGTPGSMFGELTKQPPEASQMGPTVSENERIVLSSHQHKSGLITFPDSEASIPFCIAKNRL